MDACELVCVAVTLLTGDDLFMNLVAAIVELVRLPVPQEHFAAANLQVTHPQKLSCCLRDGFL